VCLARLVEQGTDLLGVLVHLSPFSLSPSSVGARWRYMLPV
jgi:hypothetical protein